VPALALLGAGLLAAGAFAPAVTPPAGAVRSFRELAPVDGNNVLALAAVSFVLTWVFRWYRGLWATGAGTFLILAGTWLKARRAAAASSADLGWAWPALVAGGVLLLVAALVAEARRPPERPPADEDEAPLEQGGEDHLNHG
jgi:hypothetical protein